MATSLERDLSLLPKTVSKPRLVTPEAATDESAGAMAGDTMKVDVPGLARADIKKQRGQQTSVADLEAKLNTIINAPDIDSAIKANNNDVMLPNGRALEPSVLEKARTDQAFRGQLLQEFVTANTIPQADPMEPVVPFEFGLPKELTKGMPAAFVETMNGITESNVRIRDVMVGEHQNFGLNGKRLILNKFSSGDTFTEAFREIRNIPGDVIRTPYVFPMLYNGVAAVKDAIVSERNFGDELPDAFGRRMAESGFIKFGEKYLNKNIITDDRVAGLQRWYKKNYINEYGIDSWNENHTEQLIEVAEDGTLQRVRGADGKVKRRDVGLPPQVANALLELTYNELPFASKAAILFTQQAGFTYGAVKAVTGSAVKNAQRVSDARARSADPDSPDYGQYSPDMTDLQIFEKIKENEFRDANTMFGKAWAGTRTGVRQTVGRVPIVGKVGKGVVRASRKNQLNIGNTLNDINSNLKQYDESIASIEGQIDGLRQRSAAFYKKTGRVDSVTEEKIAPLQKSLDEVKANKERYTQSIGQNPYVTAAMRDEVLIASAVASAQTFMPDMDVFGVSSEIIVGVTAPLVTPAIVGLGARTVFRTGDAMTEGLFTDVASLLENSDMFPFIPRNAILNADEGAMREALEISGFNFDDTRVKAFNQFNRILRAMPEESRAEVHNALTRYTEMMQSYDDDLKALDMSDESRQNIMKNLHLSVAHASGLAPLIEFQQGKVDLVTAGKLTSTNDMAALIRATGEEMTLANGIDANIRLIREQFAADGISLADNAPLQEFIMDLENGANRQREALFVKQQQLVLLLDNYTKNIGMLNAKDQDGTLVNDLLDLAEELEEMSILPGGTVKGLVQRGEILEKAHSNMLEAAEEQVQGLRTFASDMERSEFIRESRKQADLLLDITYARRRRKATREYVKVDEMLDGREFNLVKVVERLAKISGDIEDRPIAEQLTDFGKFLRTDGKAVRKTFNTMARRALLKKGLTEKDINEYIRQRREVDGEDFDVIDLAIESINASGEGAEDLLSATFSEAEDLYRFFEIRGIGGKVDASEINQVKGEMRRLITEAYGDLDPDVKKQIEKARQTYRNEVGSRTDQKTEYAWMGPALAGRVRKDPADRPEGEGPYGYRNINSDHPEVPFLRIAEISAKMLNVRQGSQAHADLQKQLRKENDRILYAIGAKRNADGNMEIDMRDPDQVKAYGIYKNMLEAHIQHRVARDYLEKTDIAVDIIQEGMQDIPKGIGALNINRAHRMFEIENELSVDILDAEGNPDVIRGANFDNIDYFHIEFDTLLASSKKYQDEYKKLRADLDPVNGVLGVAAKQDQQNLNRIIQQLDFDAGLVNRKEAFFDVYFANATPESFNRKVKELVSTSGLPEAEVRKAMKYMYTEGLFAKARRRVKTVATKSTPEGEPLELMSLEGEVFNELTSDPNQIKLMNSVLGETHAKSLIRMRDWLSTAMGDSLDFRRSGSSGVMTIESAFSRIFNVARGMVSPLYVGTELATRAMLINQQNLLDMALNDPQAALVMGKILTNPDALTKTDYDTLQARMYAHLAKGVYLSGKNIATLEEVLADRENLRTFGTIHNPMPAEQEEENEDENVQ